MPDSAPHSIWKASVDGRDPVLILAEDLDLVRLADGSLSYIDASGKSLRVEVETVDLRAHRVVLRLDGRRHTVQLQSPLLQLIADLGLEAEVAPVLTELRAPMPGLVLRIEVEPGQEVASGDTLLVLEAMKMENALKAPVAATIAEVKVAMGQAVDKGALLLRFS